MSHYNDESAAFLTGTILLALSTRVYQDNLGVFLFGFGFVSCGTVSFLSLVKPFGTAIWSVGVMALLFYISTHLKSLLQHRLKQKVLPATRGLTTGLLCSVLMLNFDFLLSGSYLALALGATALTLAISRSLEHPALGQVGILVLGLLTYTVPALIVSVFVYLVGFQTRQKVIRGLGLLSVAWSGAFFYYSLEMTLMMKSLVLVTSGGALLLFRVLMGVRRAAVEEETYAL